MSSTNLEEAFSLGNKPKKVKAKSAEVKLIEKAAAKAFDLGSRKKKLKRKPEAPPKEALKLEKIEGDDTEKFLNQLLELKKQKIRQEKEENEEKKKEQTESESYWKNDPLKKVKEDSVEEDFDEKIDPKELGPQFWNQTDRNYAYSELLGLVYENRNKKNPSLSTERAKKIVMKPPQVMKEGAKKTNFANFKDICSTMNRSQEHFLSYLLVELGTTGSIDGNGCLILKGKFLGKDIESLLRRYMQDYVVCEMCGSLETSLTRNPTTRLHSLYCNHCKADRTVSAIKQGYQTVANKADKIKAQQGQ
jgi:translation initiation factor 2 subunit 2